MSLDKIDFIGFSVNKIVLLSTGMFLLSIMVLGTFLYFEKFRNIFLMSLIILSSFAYRLKFPIYTGSYVVYPPALLILPVDFLVFALTMYIVFKQRIKVVLEDIIFIMWIIITIINAKAFSKSFKWSFFGSLNLMKAFWVSFISRSLIDDENDVLKILPWTLIIFYAIQIIWIFKNPLPSKEIAAPVSGLWESQLKRIGGTVRHPNLLAEWLNTFLPFILYLIFLRSPKFIILFIINTIFTLSTLSRSGILGALFISVLYIYLLRKSSKIDLNRITFFLTLTLLFFLSLISFGTFFYKGNLSILKLLILRFKYSISPNIARILLLKQAWEMFKMSPVFGIGLNNYFLWQRSGFYFPFIYGYPVHNLFFLIAVETGIIGFFLFVSFWSTVFLRTYNLSPEKNLKWKYPFFLIISEYTLRNLVGWGLLNPTTLYLFFIFYGLNIKISQSQNKKLSLSNISIK